MLAKFHMNSIEIEKTVFVFFAIVIFNQTKIYTTIIGLNFIEQLFVPSKCNITFIALNERERRNNNRFDCQRGAVAFSKRSTDQTKVKSFSCEPRER